MRTKPIVVEGIRPYCYQKKIASSGSYPLYQCRLSAHACGLNPLRPNSDLSQTSHYNIKSLPVRKVMRIENMIAQVKFY